MDRGQEQLLLTVWVLVVHHIQVVFICLHVSQQVVCRDITALCFLIVCVPGEREISTSPLARGDAHPKDVPKNQQTPVTGHMDTFIPLSQSRATYGWDCATRDNLRNNLRTRTVPYKPYPHC